MQLYDNRNCGYFKMARANLAKVPADNLYCTVPLYSFAGGNSTYSTLCNWFLLDPVDTWDLGHNWLELECKKRSMGTALS
jgi:hypothetical protein